jgi:hypothetical protein
LEFFLLKFIRFRLGFYWGYQVRKADSIRTIIENCPFDDDHDNLEANYDLVIGTSERGISHDRINEFLRFQHALIVFGGSQALKKLLNEKKVILQLNNYFIFI